LIPGIERFSPLTGKKQEEKGEMAGAQDQEPMALKPDVVVTVMEDGAVLLDIGTKYFYSVNATGWAIVQMLENGASAEQIQAQCDRWDGGAADDGPIAGFIETLVRENLVIKESGSRSANPPEFTGKWSLPTIEKHKEPLQRIMVSAFDPSIPLAE
jgi:hypothetical protein